MFPDIRRVVGQHLPHAAIAIDSEGVVIFANKHAVKLLDIPLEDVVGEPLKGVICDACAKELLLLFDESSPYRDYNCRCSHPRHNLSMELEISATLGATGEGDEVIVAALRDVTSIVRLEEEIQSRASFDSMFSELISSFINTPTDELASGFRSAMERLGTYAGVDQCSWFSFDEEAGQVNCMLEWKRPEISAPAAKLLGVPIVEFPGWFSRLKAGEAVSLKSFAEAELSDMRWVERLLGIGVKSILTVPVIADEELKGFMALATFSWYRGWNDSEINSLRLLSEAFNALSERRAVEDELAAIRVRYSSLFLEMPVGSALLRHEGAGVFTFIDVNPAFERHSGIGKWQLLGHRLKSDFILEGVDFTKLAEHTLEEGVLESGEGYAPASRKYFSYTTFPMTESVVGMTLNDDTERKASSKLLRELQEQLARAQKMEAVGTLASGIAHDFNNILHTISGFAELASEKAGEMAGGEGVEKYLSRIENTVNRGAELVKNLLSFSRSQADELTALNVNVEISRTVDMLERTLLKGVRLETKLAKNLWPAASHSGKLQQVLLNLATNARDAIGEGNEGYVRIETENVILDDEALRGISWVKPGEYVHIKVTDNGCGMDSETSGHIFEPFYTTKPLGKGTGLGLATIYGIIKSHNGHITCESELGSGTTFNLYLPSARRFDLREEQIKVDIDHKHTRKINEALPRGKGETLLVVEDEVGAREVYKSTLKTLGYNVVVKGDTEGALEAFREDKDSISLVLLDLGVPRIGGERCFEEMKKIDDSVKVLVVSGYSSEERAKGLISRGALAFIEKPCEISRLAVTLREALDRQG
ncbi:MAG: hypothetical protein C0608_08335 [Deltaproteobacteria bacterium]|nr:MAG: hypothetical protein C0608_08335 [Deltaproteobacteria bacterium]